MEVALTNDEARVLSEVLANYLPQLREEVYKTENFNWRQALKKDEAVIKALMLKLDRYLAVSASEGV